MRDTVRAVVVVAQSFAPLFQGVGLARVITSKGETHNGPFVWDLLPPFRIRIGWPLLILTAYYKSSK